jgi:hypothetical protein
MSLQGKVVRVKSDIDYCIGSRNLLKAGMLAIAVVASNLPANSGIVYWLMPYGDGWTHSLSEWAADAGCGVGTDDVEAV